MVTHLYGTITARMWCIGSADVRYLSSCDVGEYFLKIFSKCVENDSFRLTERKAKEWDLFVKKQVISYFGQKMYQNNNKRKRDAAL